MPRDDAAEQLNKQKATIPKAPCPGSLTSSAGCPLGDRLNSLTLGPRGPLLLQDVQFLDELAHFDRERIPERVVHAKGGGAFGYFEVTHDITSYCKAAIFSEVGKKTPMAIRFSTVGGESGSADTARDPRGFAMKFYTEEGNWDLVGNNTPIFFIRDPILFPSFIHTQKRNPMTHLKDADMFWDFMGLRPETTHQNCFLFSDRGTPDGFRHMNGYGSHTYKLINKKGEAVFCKFHCKTDQGIKNLPVEQADTLMGTDPDYSIRDLHNAIEKGNFPSWSVKIQVMSLKEAETVKFNPFDLTKVWPQKLYPLIPVGRFTLDRNPKNYFAEIEQLAFAPSHFVPGVEASPDKMLQARLFSYSDTHRHRLGANYLLLPVNCPYRAKVSNYQRDGPMMSDGNQGGAPNYFPNSFSGPTHCPQYKEVSCPMKALEINRHESADDDNFSQPGVFYNKVLDANARARLASNLAGHIINAQPFIQDRAIANFTNVDPSLGAAIKKNINDIKARSHSHL